MNTQSVEKILSSAQENLRSGNFVRAQILFREVLCVDPNNKDALLGEVLASEHVWCFKDLLKEDPYFITSEKYRRLIQHDALGPSLQFDLDMHLQKRYRDTMKRARWPASFKNEYLDEDGYFDNDLYEHRVYHEFLNLGDYEGAAQKAEDFKELHKARRRYDSLRYYHESHLERKKAECFSKKKTSDWCVKYNALWLTLIAIIAVLGIFDCIPSGGVASESVYEALQMDNVLSVTLGIGCVLMVFFSAITYTKLDASNHFFDGFFLAILFSIINWIYIWIKSLPFVFSRRKNTIELEKVKEELENCQKEIAELSAKVELYESKFDWR